MFDGTSGSRRAAVGKTGGRSKRDGGRGSRVRRSRLIALVAIAAATRAETQFAQASTWNFNGSDVWSNAARWTGGVPDGAGAIADLTTALTVDQTITIDGSVDSVRVVGAITKTVNRRYTIAADNGGLLVFDNSASVATITQTVSNQTIGLEISAPIRLDSSLNIDNQINSASNRTLALSGEINVNGKTLTNVSIGDRLVQINGNLVGAGSVVQNPTGTASVLNLNGDNSNYTGSYTVAAGTTLLLNGTANNRINNAANVVTVNGTLDVTANSTLMAGLNGGAAGVYQRTSGGTPKTLTLAGSGSYSFGGVIQNTANSLGLVKTGSGTQTLTGSNTYNGNTSISGGTLIVNGIGSGVTSSGTGFGAVQVTGSGRLSGTGRILGNTTVASGAMLLAGDGVIAAENLELAGALTMGDGSQLALVLASGGGHSTLTLSGASSFDTDQAVTVVEVGTVAINTPFENIITGVSPTLDVSQWVLTNPYWSGTFSNDGANIDLIVTAVPEPASLAGMFVGTALLVRRRRRSEDRPH